jgi:hypothetical protein
VVSLVAEPLERINPLSVRLGVVSR